MVTIQRLFLVTTVTNLRTYRDALELYEMELLTGGPLSINFIYEELVNLYAQETDKESDEQPYKLHPKEARSN